eukprot:6352539-Pyramimonas_sp.AAC.1
MSAFALIYPKGESSSKSFDINLSDASCSYSLPHPPSTSITQSTYYLLPHRRILDVGGQRAHSE